MRSRLNLFFDLDGTLTDSSPGIIRCVNHALRELGYADAPDADLRRRIGAPLSAIFPEYFGSSDPALVDRAIAAYRRRFDEVGIFENSVFPGIEAALGVWHEGGHRLQIVTVKPAAAAARVVEHFGLARFFDAVHGPALTDRACDKAGFVGAALAHAGGRASDAVMIGDRAEDIVAARVHGVRAVAVGWGYGAKEELLAAKPDHLAETVADLVRWVQDSRTLNREP